MGVLHGGLAAGLSTEVPGILRGVRPSGPGVPGRYRFAATVLGVCCFVRLLLCHGGPFHRQDPGQAHPND